MTHRQQSVAYSARAAASLHVAADVPCTVCGYNLRTLRVQGRCPECGGSVARALAAYAPLEAGETSWLLDLALGALLLVAAALAPIVGNAARWAELWLGDPHAARRASPGEQVEAALNVVAWVLCMYAAYLLSRRESRPPPTRTEVFLRRSLRGCAVVGLASAIAWVGHTTMQGQLPPILTFIFIIAALGMFAALILGTALVYWRIRSVAGRSLGHALLRGMAGILAVTMTLIVVWFSLPRLNGHSNHSMTLMALGNPGELAHALYVMVYNWQGAWPLHWHDWLMIAYCALLLAAAGVLLRFAQMLRGAARGRRDRWMRWV